MAQAAPAKPPKQAAKPAAKPAQQAPQASTKGRPPPTADNYKGRYNAARAAQGKSRLPDDWEAHHRIPQKYSEHPEFKDFDFHASSNIQGVKGKDADVNVHQKITNLWRTFQKANPNATRKQIEDFARSIDVQFQNDWWK